MTRNGDNASTFTKAQIAFGWEGTDEVFKIKFYFEQF